MNAHAPRSYRFATRAQWRACLFEGVDSGFFDRHSVVRPRAPYDPRAQRYDTHGAHAPAVTPAGDILWHDDEGHMLRLEAQVGGNGGTPGAQPASWIIGHRRMVAQAGGLWVARGDCLERYDETTLADPLVVTLAIGPIIDIAGDGRGTLFALVRRNGCAQAIGIDHCGALARTVTFDAVDGATALVFLRRSQRFVVMTGGACQRLYWCAADTGAVVASCAIHALRAGFTATALGGDGLSRALVAGSSHAAAGATPGVLVCDDDGALLDDLIPEVRDAPLTGVSGTRDSLLVTGALGLLRYPTAKLVPEGIAEVRCSLITPMLYSPDRQDGRRWLRVEAAASLPAGATLAVSWAAPADTALHARLTSLASDVAVPASVRVRRLLDVPGVWSAPIGWRGGTSPAAAPLFDVGAPYLWVCVTLTATAGATLPSLRELTVLYGGQTLMESLPALYQRAETQPGSFLRSIVGVLEGTTQGLDARIAALAGHVHPATAPEPWLDFVARWLGLPWDDALDEQQKRRLVARAPELARARGTRAGLEALLACLIPGRPRRYRVSDATADRGFVVLGGPLRRVGTIRGSTLPALLAELTPWSRRLDSRAVLGKMRLACQEQDADPARAIAGRIRIDIAASPQERRTWEPWLAALIDEMVPLTARARLHWRDRPTLLGTQGDNMPGCGAMPDAVQDCAVILGVTYLADAGSGLAAGGARLR